MNQTNDDMTSRDWMDHIRLANEWVAYSWAYPFFKNCAGLFLCFFVSLLFFGGEAGHPVHIGGVVGGWPPPSGWRGGYICVTHGTNKNERSPARFWCAARVPERFRGASATHRASIYSHLCRFESEIPSVMEKYIFSRLHGGGGGGTTNK
jgi:hypothetical protein